MKKIINKIGLAYKIMKDPVYKNTDNLSTNEINKESNRTEIINFLLTLTK